MSVWRHIGTGVVAFAIGCGSTPPLAPPPIVARSTETLPVEPPPKAPPPESATVSDASLFADEPEPRGRKRRKRRKRRGKRTTSSLVGSSASAKSEDDVALRHRVSTGSRDSGVDDDTLKVINQNSQAISHCVADASRRGERATGKMEVEVGIDARGHVRNTRLLSEDYVGSILGTCVLRRIKEWRFVATGERTRLVLPFVVEAAY